MVGWKLADIEWRQNQNRSMYIVSAVILVLGLGIVAYSTSMATTRQESYDKGYTEGRTAGITAGISVGADAATNKALATVNSAQAYARTARDEGYQAGYQAGYQTSNQTAQAAIASAKDSSYKEGYKLGYQTGNQTGYDAGYKNGFQTGFDECTRLLGPKDELVKVLSYKMTRDSLGWVSVVGELQNISNRTLSVTLTGALLNSSGEIIATGSTLDVLNKALQPQGKAFFTLNSFYQQPQAVAARFTITWK